MHKSELEVAIVDYAGAFDDVDEITREIVALTDKTFVATVLVDALIKRVEDASALWNEIQSLGYTGTRAKANLDALRIKLREENSLADEGGGNDENAELPQNFLTD